MRYAFEPQDTFHFYGKSVTLSFYYCTGANFSGSTINCGILMAGESAVSLQRGQTATNTLSTTISPSTTWIHSTFTTTLPSTSSNYCLGLFFNYTPVGTAGTNDYMCITGVQLELGSSATNFEYRPYAIDLQLCQRYYFHLNTSDGFNGYVPSLDDNAYFTIYPPVQLRAIPVVAKQPGNGGIPLLSPSSGTSRDNSGIITILGSLSQFTLVVPCPGIGIDPGLVITNVYTSVGFGISAEL